MSILDLGDIVQAMRVMTEEEAIRWGIPFDERERYVCVETLKRPEFPPDEPPPA